MDCERQYYVNINYRPYLFYVVFGADKSKLRISKTKYNVESIPDGLDIMVITRSEHQKYMDALISGELADRLKSDDPILYEQSILSENWAIINGEIKNDKTLDYLRDTVGIVQAFIDTGAVGILDLQTKSLISPEDFGNVFKKPADPYAHVKLYKSASENGAARFLTMGCLKLGRPDISIKNIDADSLTDAAEIISQLIYFGSRGAFFTDEIKLTVKSGKSYIVKPNYTESHDGEFDRGYYDIYWKNLK